MRTKVSVFQSLDRDEKWSVAVDGQYAVSFYGARARQLAERHRDELVELIVLSERPVSEIDHVMRTPRTISVQSDEDAVESKG